MEFHNNPADGIFSIFPPLSYSLFPPPFLCISVYYTPKFPPNLAFIFLKIHPQTTLASFHFLSCADIFLWKTCYLHVHIFLIYLSPTCSIQKNNASLIQQKKYIFPQFGHKIQARFSARFITSIPCLTSGTDPSHFHYAQDSQREHWHTKQPLLFTASKPEISKSCQNPASPE